MTMKQYSNDSYSNACDETYMHDNLMTIPSKEQVNSVFTEVEGILWKSDPEFRHRERKYNVGFCRPISPKTRVL